MGSGSSTSASQVDRSGITVRVRGIYATAFTIFLREKGYTIVDISKVLSERLGLQDPGLPAKVTIKPLEERLDTILVFGYPWEYGEVVFKDLVDFLDEVFTRKSVFGNNAIVAVRVLSVDDNGAVVELPDGRQVRVQGLRSRPGSIVLVTIVHDPPLGKPVVKNEVRIVGDYVIVSKPGSGVSFSEYIRDADRRADLLMAAGLNLSLDDYHVHFRSNSKNADINLIEKEIINLKNKLDNIINTKFNTPKVIIRGEYLGFITLSRRAKEKLDDIRSKAIATIRLHHSLKSFTHRESSLVECAEDLVENGGLREEPDGIYIARYLLSSAKSITIDHIRPDGRVFRLGPFHLESMGIENGEIHAVLRREFKRSGVLDGLDLEFEPGDYSITRIDTRHWYIIHEYYTREGDLLGVYVNINTPAEAGSTGFKYLDLLIDVVKKTGDNAKIIDRDELEEAYNMGLLTRSLYEKAIYTAESLVEEINSMYS